MLLLYDSFEENPFAWIWRLDAAEFKALCKAMLLSLWFLALWFVPLSDSTFRFLAVATLAGCLLVAGAVCLRRRRRLKAYLVDVLRFDRVTNYEHLA